MTETESSCAERTGRHWIDAVVVTVKESSTFEPQIENFNHSFAYIINYKNSLIKLSNSNDFVLYIPRTMGRNSL
jgi:hypothetical protein